MTPTIAYVPLRELEYDCLTVLVCILVFICCMFIWSLISTVTKKKDKQ